MKDSFVCSNPVVSPVAVQILESECIYADEVNPHPATSEFPVGSHKTLRLVSKDPLDGSSLLCMSPEPLNIQVADRKL